MLSVVEFILNVTNFRKLNQNSNYFNNKIYVQGIKMYNYHHRSSHGNIKVQHREYSQWYCNNYVWAHMVLKLLEVSLCK